MLFDAPPVFTTWETPFRVQSPDPLPQNSAKVARDFPGYSILRNGLFYRGLFLIGCFCVYGPSWGLSEGGLKDSSARKGSVVAFLREQKPKHHKFAEKLHWQDWR